jgi:two-component system, OmpR family, sensor kinase
MGPEPAGVVPLGPGPGGTPGEPRPRSLGPAVAAEPAVHRRSGLYADRVPFGPSSLRTRLVVVFTVGSALTVLAAAAFLFMAIDRTLLAEVDSALRVRSDDLEVIARSSGGEIPDRDPFAQILQGDGTGVVVVDASPSELAKAPALTADQLTPGRLPASGAFYEAHVDALGGPARLWARPVELGGRRVGLVVGDPLDQYTRTRDTLLLVLAVGGPALVAVSAAAGWLLAGAALRPVRRMAQEADAISITDLDRRLEVPPGNDEIADLGRTLNAMLGRLEDAIDHERRFLDDASHELRTPLTILRGELELALAQPDDHDEVVAALRSALDEAERLSRLSNDLLVLARSRSGGAPVGEATCDLDAVIRRAVELVGNDGSLKVVVAGAGGMIACDARRVEQVVSNLVTNARRYADHAVRVDVARDDAQGDGSWVSVRVADDGPGFPASMLPVTFERFVRPDAARSRADGGTGLGLAISAEAVRAVGGTITAGNGGPLGGAVVTARFPLAGR